MIMFYCFYTILLPDSCFINSTASSAVLPTNSGQHVFGVDAVICIKITSKMNKEENSKGLKDNIHDSI